MKLNDLGPLMARRRDGGLSFGFDRFRADPALAALLHWPDDVLRDFLFDHGDNGHFLDDYGDVDLCAITWARASECCAVAFASSCASLPPTRRGWRVCENLPRLAAYAASIEVFSRKSCG
ncbi:hypothetical protein [Streptomyces thermolilacinus]|uniref:hypothetical protein n=1 Tax=Streptomyces thermolilacinus TaxID=285540 RepID=UPI0033FD22E7